MLANDTASVQIRLSPVQRAKLLWCERPGADKESILRSAMMIDPGGSNAGWVDRYGGSGLGGNGGSGRAGIVGNWYIKGIGATPLIGATTLKDHASGNAYLEEAIRETIFAEVLAMEAPWGAIKTSAIVDVCEDRIWPPDPNSHNWVAKDRCVLLFRELFVRPAHFQRAIHFTGKPELVGAPDARRRSQNLEFMVAALGESPFAESIRSIWARWAEQCAYLYAWRLSQGPLSTSNLSFDGRLLDFGATSSVPDWRASVVCQGSPENGYELQQLIQFALSFFEELSFEDGLPIRLSEDDVAAIIQECSERYYLTIGIEVLRLAGFRRATIYRLLSDASGVRRLSLASERLIRSNQRQFSLEISLSDYLSVWNFMKFWSDDIPTQYREFRAIGDELRTFVSSEPIAERMKTRCLSRPELSREHLRLRIHSILSQLDLSRPAAASGITHLIQSEVVRARRDSFLEPEHGFLRGFAIRGSEWFVLFEQIDGQIYAVKELPHSRRQVGHDTNQADRLAWNDNGTIDGLEAEYINMI